MRDDLLWLRMTVMLAIMGSMFAFPIIVIARDERRKRRAPEAGDDAD